MLAEVNFEKLFDLKPELPESVAIFFSQFDGQTLNFMTFEDCKCLKDVRAKIF